MKFFRRTKLNNASLCHDQLYFPCNIMVLCIGIMLTSQIWIVILMAMVEQKRILFATFMCNYLYCQFLVGAVKYNAFLYNSWIVIRSECCFIALNIILFFLPMQESKIKDQIQEVRRNPEVGIAIVQSW